MNGPLLMELVAAWAYNGVMFNRLNQQNWDTIITPLGTQIVDNTKYLQDLIDLHLPKLANQDIRFKNERAIILGRQHIHNQNESSPLIKNQY